MDLDFCVLEITILHSLQSFSTLLEKFRNLKAINAYFQNSGYANEAYTDPDFLVQLQFTNEQLNCELNIVDSLEDESDNFTFIVYNLPSEPTFSVGDYLLFKFYWSSDPNKYTIYQGAIKDIGIQRQMSEIKTTIKGELIHQNILYNWRKFEKYPKISYVDIHSFIENELGLRFETTFGGWDYGWGENAILTKGKSIGKILDLISDQINSNLKANGEKDKAHWKLMNNTTIFFYKDSDVDSHIFNEQLMINVPSIKYNDLLAFQNNTENYEIELYGIPELKAGVVIYIDVTSAPSYVTETSAYYKVEEVEHSITCCDGYLMKLYAQRL